MTFVQLIAFESDDIDSLLAREWTWLEATAGRRTPQRSALYRDVTQPNRYVSYNAFPDRAAAAVNSALPETDANAAEVGALVGPAVFTDLELVGDTWDASLEVAERFRAYLETSGQRETGVVAEDVRVTMLLPDLVGDVSGRATVAAGLLAESPARRFDRYEVQPTRDGFLADTAYRTVATDTEPSRLSVGLVAATVEHGVVTRPP